MMQKPAFSARRSLAEKAGFCGVLYVRNYTEV